MIHRSTPSATLPARLRELAERLAELALPSRCAVCGDAPQAMDPWPLCGAHAILRAAQGGCARCALPLPPGVPAGERCAACRRRSPGVSSTAALGAYAGGLREHVLGIKHGGRRDLARLTGRALGALALERWGSAPRLLVPVPLHPLRSFERGYDQAWRIAAGMAAQTGWRLARGLRRRRATAPQGSLAAVSRAANVSGAFVPAARLQGADCVLVDDVATSMSTAQQCARALRAAGSGDVRLAVLARASS